MKSVAVFVPERINLSVRLKRLITLLSHTAVICFQVQQGLLCSTSTAQLSCGSVCVRRDTNYLSRCVLVGKLLVTCVGKDQSISPTAQITRCLQGVKLQSTGEETRRRVQSVFTARLSEHERPGRAHGGSACCPDMSHLDSS